MTDRRRNGLILLLVAGLLAASAIAIAFKPTRLGLDLKGGVELVYQGEPTQQVPTVTPEALDRALDIIRSRVDQLGVGEPEIQRSGEDQISVGLPDVQDIRRAKEQVGTPAQLYFYDWERNALTPDGRAVAPELPAQNPDAQRISQGAGDPTQGQPLYDAVKFASRLRAVTGARDGSRIGSAYYLFDRTHQYLAGPERFERDLLSALDRRSFPDGSDVLSVPQGYVVLQAVARTADEAIAADDSAARFYVLRDRIALSGKDIKDPQQGFDELHEPDVEFRFTNAGKAAFQDVTATIAQRGLSLQLPGVNPTTVLQHFAVALDGRLISVASIDPRELPDGIDGENGAIIRGGFRIQTAQDLANLLKLGALPIGLKLISQSQVSATLGKQALDQGLVAGIAGFVIVAIFLIVFYRILGVIAVGALCVYAAYFYALIKLIPITLTLPGIAGIILTIGVAADANIVIFERIKEESRKGHSMISSITTGYKRGISTIIDANVITLLTAFILFGLATAGVKGFAFTLGIGTIVSLLTAVVFTRAVLGLLGRSPILRSPRFLGAGEQRVSWHFDFAGASRWFFSISG
ncbi:MAG TPA: protein translocase subunit SecD, partial [Conexibacter sp.]